MKIVHDPGGAHRIYTEFDEADIMLVRVRPRGTIEIGGLAAGLFSKDWIPEIIAALQLAHKIASREKPWEPYNE